MKNVLITGASSGLGRATARLLARNNYRLVICGRRQDRIQDLEKELSELTTIHSLIFDVRDREAVQSAIDSLPAPFRPLDVLVNNAGNAHGLDFIQQVK